MVLFDKEIDRSKIPALQTKNTLSHQLNMSCIVYKGMLKPIIISNKLTTSQLLTYTIQIPTNPENTTTKIYFVTFQFE